MRRFILIAALLGFICSNAQVTILEPDFEQEAIIVKNETEGINLEIEHAKGKTTANMGMALLGVVKTSQYYEIQGPASPVTLDNSYYNKDLQFIISWSDNKRSPQRLFQIIPLEIQSKRRIYNIGKFNSFSGATNADQGYIKFTAVKYGEHSYLVTISKDELMKFRDDKNTKEVEKFGKQYVIRLLNASTDKISDTEDFLSFGIGAPTKEQFELMKSSCKIVENNTEEE